jgi:hypothetical protein
MKQTSKLSEKLLKRSFVNVSWHDLNSKLPFGSLALVDQTDNFGTWQTLMSKK